MEGRAALHRIDAASGRCRHRRSSVAATGDVPKRRRGIRRDPRAGSETGDKKWDFKMVNYTESGVLSTAGDLVFGGGWMAFVALDAKTGELLWHVNLGGPNASGN
jgi:hypothetical protein